MDALHHVFTSGTGKGIIQQDASSANALPLTTLLLACLQTECLYLCDFLHME